MQTSLKASRKKSTVSNYYLVAQSSEGKKAGGCLAKYHTLDGLGEIR